LSHGLSSVDFKLDAQAVGDSIDEGEIGCDHTNVEYCRIGITCAAQGIHVGLRDPTRCARQLRAVVQHCPVRRGEVDTTVVRLQAGHEVGVFCELTERRPVMFQSVMALIDLRNDDGNHLPLGPGEFGAFEHQCLV